MKKAFAHIIAADGEVECAYCDPTGKKGTMKDGLTIDVNGVEMEVCWRHLQAVVRTAAVSKRREEELASANGD